jgi:hypothetical protein
LAEPVLEKRRRKTHLNAALQEQYSRAIKNTALPVDIDRDFLLSDYRGGLVCASSEGVFVQKKE